MDTPTTLLTLPTELRLMIYGHVMEGLKEAVKTLAPTVSLRIRRFDSNILSLRATCKQLKEEATHCIFSSNYLYLYLHGPQHAAGYHHEESDGIGWLPLHPAQSLHVVVDIAMINFWPFLTIFENILSNLSRRAALKRLTIRISLHMCLDASGGSLKMAYLELAKRRSVVVKRRRLHGLKAAKIELGFARQAL